MKYRISTDYPQASSEGSSTIDRVIGGMEFFSTSTFWNRKSDNYHRAVRLHTHAVTITVLVLNSDVKLPSRLWGNTCPGELT